MEKNFKGIFPFTTEAISKYFPLFEFKDKDVLTVGSSGDQAFNALLLGAGKVTIFDISPFTEEFVKLKRDLLLNYNREEFYKKVVQSKEYPMDLDYYSFSDLEKMNPYMKDDVSYDLLRKKLESSKIDFITGDVFKMKDSLSKEKYDCMIFSNVLQYLSKNSNEKYIRKCFSEWISFLNKDGILQLMYYYSVFGQKQELIKLLDSLWDQNLQISQFRNINGNGDPAVLYYRK